MRDIPFTRFRGPLKRLELSGLSAAERAVFDALFPRFLAEDVPRRFAGFSFPRRRYYTLGTSDTGTDDHTLAHELRAYRNPATCGMVEVVDLVEVGGFTFAGGEKIAVERGTALGVLIHHPSRMPPEYKNVARQELRTSDGESAHLLRFPYVVYEGEFGKSIDLRLPEVRQWFFEMFRDRKEPDGVWWLDVADWPDSMKAMMAEGIDSSIARSCFNLDDGRAPLPKSFPDMLPTLINPDLGGGPATSTGSTLYGISHWLRSHEAEALIYPSARCDAFVRRKGKEWEFAGWCLVDYRNVAADRGVHSVVPISSPWCWPSLPEGVTATFTSDGGFAVEGMVNFWALDYLTQVHSMRLAESELSLPPPRGAGFNPFEAWELGIYLLRWLTIAIGTFDREQTEWRLRVLAGLAVRHDLYRLTGRADELFTELGAGADSNTILHQARALADRVAAAVHDDATEVIVRAGIGFETLMLSIVVAARWGQPGMWDRIAFETAPAELSLSRPLTKRIQTFLRELPRGAKPFRAFIDEGNAIEAAVSRELRSRSSLGPM